jgi:hypothetical protein
MTYSITFTPEAYTVMKKIFLVISKDKYTLAE